MIIEEFISLEAQHVQEEIETMVRLTTHTVPTTASAPALTPTQNPPVNVPTIGSQPFVSST